MKKLPESITVGNYTFNYNMEHEAYECRGSVSYDHEGDEQPEKSLWKAAITLEQHLNERDYETELNYSEKGLVKVSIL